MIFQKKNNQIILLMVVKICVETIFVMYSLKCHIKMLLNIDCNVNNKDKENTLFYSLSIFLLILKLVLV